MERLVIEGGRQLKGTVRVSGAKNAVLKLLAAALMTSETCTFRNVPDLADVDEMISLLRGLGAEVWNPEPGVLQVRARSLHHEAPEDAVRRMRASIQVMGPLLGRLGKVRIALPGGCDLGPRPIDLHLKGLSALGAQIEEKAGHVEGSARRLRGADIYLDQPSVGATENIMMAAVFARGVTRIHNAAQEPEIVDVAKALTKMGARIAGAGTSVIRVEGVTELGGCDHTVLPDRIEAGTFMVAAALVGEDVCIEPVIPEHIDAITAKLREMGAGVEIRQHRARVWRRPLRAVRVQTRPHPGFPTDMQPQIVAALSLAKGTSIVSETVFSSRFKYVDELRRMGADIAIVGNVAVIRGTRSLSGCSDLEATDLRAGAALVLAALAAEGATAIGGLHHIDRGYEDLCGKLQGIGANIERLQHDPVAIGQHA